MKSQGNGSIRTCVGNLLRITRGENPYERLKGLDSRLIDKPTSTVRDEMSRDARWLIETYEPRAEIEGISAAHSDDVNGGLVISAKIKGEGNISNG